MRNNHASAPLRRFPNQLRQFRPRIIRRVLTITVCRLHYKKVGDFTLRRTRVNDFSGGNVLIVDASDVSGEKQPARLAVSLERQLCH